MKKFTRQDGFSESALLHSAVDHLGSARVLFDRSPSCFDSAGYLCHLGIELVLKAMLLNKCDWFPDEHSLAKLSASIVKQNVKLHYGSEHEDIVRTLDKFNGLRYPQILDPIEIGDDDWCRIENLFDFLILSLPTGMQNELKQMDHSNKGNRILMSKKKDI